MTIRELSKSLTCEVRITFDEEPLDGTVDVIVPMTSSATDVLNDDVLNLEVHLIDVDEGAVVVSTNTR